MSADVTSSAWVNGVLTGTPVVEYVRGQVTPTVLAVLELAVREGVDVRLSSSHVGSVLFVESPRGVTLPATMRAALALAVRRGEFHESPGYPARRGYAEKIYDAWVVTDWD